MWVVEGLSDDRFAIVSKSHHCLVDGVSGVDITTVLFDAEADPAPADDPPEWIPRPEPSSLELLARQSPSASSSPPKSSAAPRR